MTELTAFMLFAGPAVAFNIAINAAIGWHRMKARLEQLERDQCDILNQLNAHRHWAFDQNDQIIDEMRQLEARLMNSAKSIPPLSHSVTRKFSID